MVWIVLALFSATRDTARNNYLVDPTPQLCQAILTKGTQALFVVMVGIEPLI
jgi:hypothetical protein